jgi:hypothetical protein
MKGKMADLMAGTATFMTGGSPKSSAWLVRKLQTRKILQRRGLAFKLLLKISGARQKLSLAVNAITNRQL